MTQTHRHDAESIFWFLVWWVVHATPAGGDATEIPNELRVPLVGITGDVRSLGIPAIYHMCPYLSCWANLGKLLNLTFIGQLINPIPIPNFSTKSSNVTLNFIFENQDKEFMNLVKADVPRKPTKVTTISTPQILSLHSRSGGSKHSRDSEPESVSWLFLILCLQSFICCCLHRRRKLNKNLLCCQCVGMD